MMLSLNVPEDVYNRALRIAEETSQPVEQILLDHLRRLPDAYPGLPDDEQEELKALRSLSDDALWAIAREQMPSDVQERMHILMDANNHGAISDEEYAELSGYVERGNRLMVRKAEAAGILMEHGYPFTQQDFKPRDE
jgi:hypothetical protein